MAVLITMPSACCIWLRTRRRREVQKTPSAWLARSKPPAATEVLTAMPGWEGKVLLEVMVCSVA